MRSQIAMELRAHIAERSGDGRPLADVLRQLGNPTTLAESYLSAVPLEAARPTDRAIAKLIDATIAMVLLSPILYLCSKLAPPEIPVVRVLSFVALFGGGLLLGVYTAIAEARSDRTLGKRVMGLRVVRESGARISGGQAVVRQLPIVLQVIWVDALFVFFTERSQRAFELLSKTRVVRVPGPEQAGSK
ncbi:MAG: RDD family protein [bacterium]